MRHEDRSSRCRAKATQLTGCHKIIGKVTRSLGRGNQLEAGSALSHHRVMTKHSPVCDFKARPDIIRSNFKLNRTDALNEWRGLGAA